MKISPRTIKPLCLHRSHYRNVDTLGRQCGRRKSPSKYLAVPGPSVTSTVGVVEKPLVLDFVKDAPEKLEVMR